MNRPLQNEKQQLLHSFKFPLFFVALIWLIKIIEVFFRLDLHIYGIFPMSASGLPGIATSPLIHGSFKHLMANSGPIVFLGAGVHYFYKRKAFRIWLMSWFFTGILVWLAGREAYHIGASGIIYCFASFLFFSGIIKRHTPLMAISLLIVFFYGGMFWGILPTKGQISWEAHLMGFLVGIFVAYRYKDQGPSRKRYPWENDDDEDGSEFHSDNTANKGAISYHYRDRKI